MARTGSRLSGRRWLIVAAIVALTVAVLAVGNPLEHPEAGEQTSGERGVSGIPRVVFYAALAIAFVLGFPPRSGSSDPGERDGGLQDERT